MSKKNVLLEEIFIVKEVNTDFFAKVPRIKAISEYHNTTELALDVNFDIYPMKVGSSYRIALATALRDDGIITTGTYNPEDFEKPSLLDKYEYVMFGKIFKIEEKAAKKELAITASFGGLLMLLKGEPSILSNIPYDARVYILIKQALQNYEKERKYKIYRGS